MLLTIQFEINNNRPVMACYKGWNISTIPEYGSINTTGGEPHKEELYNLVILANNETTGENYDENTDNDLQSVLGLTVLIVGYIPAGSVEDKEGNTDWLIVRDINKILLEMLLLYEDKTVNDLTGWNGPTFYDLH